MSLRTFGTGASSGSSFSLIEVVCALAIAATLLTAILQLLSLTVRTAEHSRSALAEARVAATLAHHLQRELRFACAVKEPGMFGFVGQPPGVAGGGIVLAFFTTYTLAPARAYPISGVCRVEYLLRPSPRREGTSELVRRERSYGASETDEGNTATEVLADGISGWQLEFSDGVAWSERWARDRLPVAIRLRYARSSASGEGPSHYEIGLVPLVAPDANPMPVLAGGETPR